MNKQLTKTLGAGLLALTVLGAQSAMADDFVLTINIPVSATRLSPRMNYVLANCDLFHRDGSPIKDQIPSEDCCGSSDIGSSRSFNGVLPVHMHFDMAKAQTIDWGTYTCYLRFSADNNNLMGYFSENNADPVFRAQTGSVMQVSGKLY